MRYALAVKPHSKEAIEIGCTCKGEKPEDDCPIHFPIKYIRRFNRIDRYIGFIAMDLGAITTACKIIITLLSISLIATGFNIYLAVN